jgi:hypothetical protein
VPIPSGNWNLEFLDLNGQRAYPLTERASRRDISGSFRIPNSLLLGLYLPVHAGLAIDSTQFFVRTLTVFGNGLSLAIAYNDDEEDPTIVATAVVPFAGHVEYQSYALGGQGDFDDTVGKVVIGRLDELLVLSPGQYHFTYEAGQLEVDAIRPMIRGVSRLVLINNGERSDPLTGDVELVAGANMRLSLVQSGSQQQIRFDAIDGEGLSNACDCEDDTPCLKTINGVAPNADGNLTLLGDDCVSFESQDNGLRINDNCSRPCCGCAELERVTTDLQRFSAGAVNLDNFVTRLESTVTQFSAVVLGSRLSDTGCLNL